MSPPKPQGSLDFASLISGPLTAILEAQARAAWTSTRMIRELAFDRDGEPVRLEFGLGERDDVGRRKTLSLPLLSFLPIQYLTIERAELEFQAQIVDVTQATETRAGLTSVRTRLRTRTARQRGGRDDGPRARSHHLRVVLHVRADESAAPPPSLDALLDPIAPPAKDPG